jgi:hypothetical protein
MERFLSIQLDTDYRAVMRRVRASWGGLTIGSVIDVQLDSNALASQWVRCRIERAMSGRLMVTRA